MKKSVLCFLILGVAGLAQAESKIGFVDMQKALQATTSGKKAKDMLEGELTKRKKDLDKKKADIEKMGQDLEKKKTVLSEEVMGRKRMEIEEEMIKFQKIVSENQMEIQKKEKELVEPILEKMKKMIDKVAQEKGYTMVLDKQGQNVLYSQKDADLTENVIQEFEKSK